MGWLRRLRSTIVAGRLSDEFDEETRFHIAELADKYVQEGMSPGEARRRAERQFGNVLLTRERTRDADTLRWLTDAAQDLRFAGRTLRKNPGFTVVAVLTLALGIGANTAIFTLFDAILLRSLPVHEPSRLVLFSDGAGEGTSTGDVPTGHWERFSFEVYQHLRQQSLPFESLAAVRSGEATVLVRLPGGERAQRAQAHLVSGNYFQTMGVDAVIGRTLTLDDDRPNAAPVAVVSGGYWRQRLNANPGVVGTTVTLNTTAFTIVGVTPPEFFGERVRRTPDFWMPLVFQPAIELRPSYIDRADSYWLSLIGRLAPGATQRSAQASTTAALQQFLTSQAGAKLTSERERAIRNSRIELANGASGVSGLRYLYSQPLHVLLVVVALVLLIACANVANLLLTRAAARRGEISMRIALGASRARLVRQLLTESLLLAAVGAVGGVLIARWVTGALIVFVVSASSPVHADLSVPVLVFTIVVAVAAGVLFGIAPAVHASRIDVVTAMKVRQGGGIATGGRFRAANALVAVQIGVSLVLLVGASLFARSLLNIQRHPLGFDANHVLLAGISPRLAGYKPAAVGAMYQTLYDRVSTLPGIRSGTMARYSPLGGSRSVNGGRVEAYSPKPGEEVTLETILVGPSYPETLGIPLLQGRAINLRDLPTGPKVGMVNEAFVRQYFPNANPIGRHFSLDDTEAPNIEIVGVLGDAQFHNVRDPIKPIVFTALFQDATQFALDCELELRTTGDPGGAASEVRRTVADVDPNLTMSDPTTLLEQVSKTFDSQRLAAQLVSFFGLLALTLACVGLYGTIAQNVAHRTNEIGVRMALGAERGRVVWMILRQTLVLLVIGLIVGLPTALLAARLVASQLFGLSIVDPPSFFAAVALLVTVAMCAGLVPARRATRVNPVTALRSE
jgi:predicted permease